MTVGERHGLRGYVTNRKFADFLIPIPLQSLALRDYCSRKKKVYVLPANETCFPHSYMVLEGIIEDLASFEGVVMYSMHMLPKRAERRKRIYRRVLEQGCALHLVLEDLVISAPDDISEIEDVLVFTELALRAPKLEKLES
jgi:sporadic carbohydrate cluster protein (TIGR04323 family)